MITSPGEHRVASLEQPAVPERELLADLDGLTGLENSMAMVNGSGDVGGGIMLKWQVKITSSEHQSSRSTSAGFSPPHATKGAMAL